MEEYTVESEKIYRLRRGLLTAVADYVNPVNLDYVLAHPELLGVEPDAALDQWRGLIENGYLKAVPGTCGEYATITELGKAQLPTSSRRDYKAYVWGRMAM